MVMRCPFCGRPGGLETADGNYYCAGNQPACRLVAREYQSGVLQDLPFDLAYYTNIARYLEAWPTPPTVY